MPPPSESIDLRLAALDRDQLDALVRRMLAHDPDLEHLVHLPLAGEVRSVDGRHLAAQVTHILRTMGDDWRAPMRTARELGPMVELAESYVDVGSLADARTSYTAIATTILDHYEQIRDDHGEVAGIVGQCVEGLGRCLANTRDPEGRMALLGDVFAVYRWDALDHGGYGMEDAPRTVLLMATTPAEKVQIAAWVRAALPRGGDEHRRWCRQRAGRLVLDLIGNELDAAAREELYAEADLDRLRLDLLLEQGRTDEAIQLVRATSGRDLVKLADRLTAAGLGEAARAAVRDHLAVLDPDHHRVRGWLVAQAVPLPSNLDELLAAVSRFQVRTTIGAYQDLRREAEDAGRWPGVLSLVGDLDPHPKKLQPVRARIRADLGDANGALAELEGLKGSTWKSAAQDVAAALELTHPDVAGGLLQRLIDVLLDHDTKASRAEAAELRERLDTLGRRDG